MSRHNPAVHSAVSFHDPGVEASRLLRVHAIRYLPIPVMDEADERWLRRLMLDRVARLEGKALAPESSAAGQASPAPSHDLPEDSFQQRVEPWLLKAFGRSLIDDRVERNARFLEEALELVQACGGSAEQAHQLVDYVFSRAVGERDQEVGGVMVTLAALCLAQGLEMSEAGERELARIWKHIPTIRAKQACKAAQGVGIAPPAEATDKAVQP